jgi:GNAT superfamily N-acetyltransferase
MIIRSTTEEDWSLLRSIRLASLLDAPTAFGITHASAAANTDEQWRDRAANRGPGRFLLALIDGVAVGLVGSVVSDAHDLNLIAMWVAPDHRGSGAAARLVDAVKARAVSEGHAQLLLDVSPENARAAAFYVKEGFVFDGHVEPLASHPHINVQRMVWMVAV